ncbi:hypothetical protein TSUD_260010 [Trifolium subterraneum]|uniref:Reverse transcriptase zinc-binding domain-containing protein n=1 Tax=Trifolium subterraneum TaxID=3900 RepID=A0A2Z6N8Q3_TRISU|nr:hypothetical protein TSUD_260010 [Trifolium subterraneum]
MYRRGSLDDTVIAKGLDSHLWKLIVKLWPKLEELSSWTLGNGKTVEWYKDIWIDKGLRVADPNLNIPANMHDWKVVQLVDDDGSWKRSVFVEWLPFNIMK